MARITYDFLANMSGDFIGGLSRSEARDLLRKAREKFKTRQKQLEKVERSVYSHALEQTRDYYKYHPQKAISRTSRQDAQKELTKLRDFFASESSSVKGARKIQREQDISIFGAKDDGSPKYRMSLEQRKKFWSMYNEFNKTYKTATALFGSNAIMQYLGQIAIARGKEEISTRDFGLLLDVLEEQMEYDRQLGYDESWTPDWDWESPTYSGTRNY